MVFWRGHADSNSAAQAAAATQAAAPKATPDTTTKPKPKPPALNPDGTPRHPRAQAQTQASAFTRLPDHTHARAEEARPNHPCNAPC